MLIEYNLERVDTVLGAVNSLVGDGMAWGDVEQMIREERRAGNPVAALIQSMDLPNNKVTVSLTNHLDAQDEEEAGELLLTRTRLTLNGRTACSRLYKHSHTR
jgi:hypothetical protein